MIRFQVYAINIMKAHTKHGPREESFLVTRCQQAFFLFTDFTIRTIVVLRIYNGCNRDNYEP